MVRFDGENKEDKKMMKKMPKRRSAFMRTGTCAIAFAALTALDCAGVVLRPGATEVVIPQKAPNTVMFAAREATEDKRDSALSPT
jgi:hypothetical protein